MPNSLLWHTCSHALSGDTWKRGDLDFTGGMMILVLRALSLCTNRTDGYNSSKRAGVNGSNDNGPAAACGASVGTADMAKAGSNGLQHVQAEAPPGTAPDNKPPRSKQISTYLQERQLETTPGLLDIAAFFFANGSLLGGPFFEYKEWRDFLNREGAFYEVRRAGLFFQTSD